MANILTTLIIIGFIAFYSVKAHSFRNRAEPKQTATEHHSSFKKPNIENVIAKVQRHYDSAETIDFVDIIDEKKKS